MAAALLPLLFAMQQFVARANSLAINLLHQLASLCARLTRPARQKSLGLCDVRGGDARSSRARRSAGRPG